MATIAENLNTLIETKNNIKTSLEAKGQDLTDVPFAEYSSKIDAIPVIEITSAKYLFYGDDRTDEIEDLISAISPKCTDFSSMFAQAVLLTEIPFINTSNGINFNSMFQRCLRLEAIPELDTSKGTNMSGMFNQCSSLTEIPLIDTSKATNLSSFFNSCSNLIAIPDLDTSSSTNFQGFANGCNKITSFPKLNTSLSTSFYETFYNCSSLLEIPELDTTNSTTFYQAFRGCSALTKIPALNLGKVNNITTMLTNCTSLTELGGFIDLGKAFTATTTNYQSYRLDLSTCTLLTHDSLMNVINNLYDLNLSYNVASGKTLYTQALILGSTNLAKLTEEEIAIATNKGWVVS